jgi:hypothetical protein
MELQFLRVPEIARYVIKINRNCMPPYCVDSLGASSLNFSEKIEEWIDVLWKSSSLPMEHSDKQEQYGPYYEQYGMHYGI